MHQPVFRRAWRLPASYVNPHFGTAHARDGGIEPAGGFLAVRFRVDRFVGHAIVPRQAAMEQFHRIARLQAQHLGMPGSVRRQNQFSAALQQQRAVQPRRH